MAKKKSSEKKSKQNNNSSAPIGYENELWQMADALRGNMDAAEYKHVVLEQAEVFAEIWAVQ